MPNDATEVVPHANVYEAVAAAMHDCGYVQRGTAPGLNYSFASERSVLEEVRPVFLAHGLFMYPSAVLRLELETHEIEKEGWKDRRTGEVGPAKKQLLSSARAVMEFTVSHAASNTHLTMVELGEGADYGDKALGKVTTYAFKGALRRIMMLVTGDDPDQTPSEEFEREPPRQQQRPPATRAAPKLAGVAAAVGATPAEDGPFTHPEVMAMSLDAFAGNANSPEGKAFQERVSTALRAELARDGVSGRSWNEALAAAHEKNGRRWVEGAIGQAITDAKGGAR